jgi:hypothetical protein
MERKSNVSSGFSRFYHTIINFFLFSWGKTTFFRKEDSLTESISGSREEEEQGQLSLSYFLPPNGRTRVGRRCWYWNGIAGAPHPSSVEFLAFVF